MKEAPSMSAIEIAKLKKVGAPAIRQKAIKEQWHFKEVKVNGGLQKRFFLYSLPVDILVLIKTVPVMPEISNIITIFDAIQKQHKVIQCHINETSKQVKILNQLLRKIEGGL